MVLIGYGHRTKHCRTSFETRALIEFKVELLRGELVALLGPLLCTESLLCIHSGGHLNPAVTLGVFCTGTLSPVVALGYVAAQLLGGVTASGLAKVCLLCHSQLHC